VKIVVAPNAFKGSLSAGEAADAMRSGILKALAAVEVRLVPVADGGDGLLQALAGPLQAGHVQQQVHGPLGEPVEAAFLYSAAHRLAVIEMATASGLALLDPAQLDAMHASSEGTGQLIRAALDLGARHIVLGIGGSATTDGATGLASALGMRFLDENGEALPGNGASLERIRRIDRSGVDERLAGVTLEVACDVDNPLLGGNGAARVYAPQKGASRDQIGRLERGLTNLADVIRQEFGLDVRELPGGGAAGGMGAGLRAFFGAELKPGADLVLELLQVEAEIAGADLVLTGEGRLDDQTRFGKAPGAIAALARRNNVPCIAVAGMLDQTAYTLNDAGFTAVFSLCPGPIPLADAVDNAARYLTLTTEQIMRCTQWPRRNNLTAAR